MLKFKFFRLLRCSLVLFFDKCDKSDRRLHRKDDLKRLNTYFIKNGWIKMKRKILFLIKSTSRVQSKNLAFFQIKILYRHLYSINI
jgi:hypothetical protein